MPMSEVLAVDDIVAGYGRALALRGVSLSLRVGENVGLVGPNGAGKSTFFKVLSGIIRARSGRAVFDGKRLDDMTSDAIVRAGVVQVPEGRQVFPGLSVDENLWLGGYAAPEQRPRRRAEVLELFPKLADRINQAADSLSGGEQQMLAIGRGLMAAPRLLLLDEPTLGLAPVVVDQLIVALRAMTARLGVTLLIAEQSVHLAQELCSTIHVLVDGRIARSVEAAKADRETLMGDYLGQH